MSRTAKDESAPRHAASRACDDPLRDYLAVSVSRCQSGRLRVHVTRMDMASRRVVPTVVFDEHEPRTSQVAMAEWLSRGTAQHLLDVEDQLGLW